MARCLFLLAVLLLWAPDALALFPPCPKGGIRLVPLDSGTSVTGNTPWFTAEYTQHPKRSGPVVSRAGKCEDRRPLLDANPSSGHLLLSPNYAPKADFGIIALPKLSDMDIGGLQLQYGLDFDVSTKAPANSGDWFDIVQLEFARSVESPDGPIGSRSALYRVRKVAYDKGPVMIEVIESRNHPDGIAVKPPPMDVVVATIPLPADAPMTTMHLRWTQSARTQIASEPNLPNSAEPPIDTVLEVIGPENMVLYSVALTGQWADTLSIGLLDYNVPSLSTYGPGSDLYLDEVWLSADALEK